MALRYWVGGTDTWNATAGTKWATSSGGAGGAAAPTAADDVIFDLNSGGAIVATSTAVACRSLQFTDTAGDFTGEFVHPASTTISIGDATSGAGDIAFKLVASMTYTLGSTSTSAITFVSTSTTEQAVDCAGKQTGNLVFNGTGGNWRFDSSQTCTGTVSLTRGRVNLNGQTLSWGIFSSSNTNTRTIVGGAATLTLTGSSTTVFDMAVPGSATVSLNDPGFTMTSTGANATITAVFGVTIRSLTLSGSGTATVNNGGSYVNLTRTGTSAKTDELVFGSSNNPVTGTFTVTGNDSTTRRLLVRSSALGTARTITAGAVSASNVDFRDITGAGTGSWNLSAITGGSGDCGGNSGITFTTPTTCAYSGSAGGFFSALSWSPRVPLPQDDATITSAFSASQTVTIDKPRLCKGLDFTGVTGSPTLSFTDSTILHGSLTLISGMSTSGSAALNLQGRSSHTLTTAGKSLPGTVSITSIGGTYTLSDNLTTASTFTVNNGTFNANGYNVTCANFNSNNSNTRAITGGSGAWTTTNGANSFPWDITTSTNLTANFTATTIAITNANSNQRAFVGGGQSYGTLNYIYSSASIGRLEINQSNTFGTLNVSNSAAAMTLRFQVGTTTTILNSFNVSGGSGRLITIETGTGGSTATLTKSSGIVSCDYLSIRDSIATGGAAWYAGANSTNVSNNTGWIFTAPSQASAVAFLGFFS